MHVPQSPKRRGYGVVYFLDCRLIFFFSSRRRHTRFDCDWSSDVCSSDLGFTARGATFQLSYTFTHARDQSSFSCCAASQGFSAPTTAGDPNAREWATSSFERRHSFLGTVTYPITGALEVTAIGRLTSGVPFTPLVGSDVNGDGARNDRAVVFDPAT